MKSAPCTYPELLQNLGVKTSLWPTIEIAIKGTNSGFPRVHVSKLSLGAAAIGSYLNTHSWPLHLEKRFQALGIFFISWSALKEKVATNCFSEGPIIPRFFPLISFFVSSLRASCFNNNIKCSYTFRSKGENTNCWKVRWFEDLACMWYK